MAILAAAALFSACEEFQPVFTGNYGNPAYKEPQTMTPTMTIADLKALYTANGNKPITIEEPILIGGQVTTSDKVGISTRASISRTRLPVSRSRWDRTVSTMSTDSDSGCTCSVKV